MQTASAMKTRLPQSSRADFGCASTWAGIWAGIWIGIWAGIWVGLGCGSGRPTITGSRGTGWPRGRGRSEGLAALLFAGVAYGVAEFSGGRVVAPMVPAVVVSGPRGTGCAAGRGRAAAATGLAGGDDRSSAAAVRSLEGRVAESGGRPLRAVAGTERADENGPALPASGSAMAEVPVVVEGAGERIGSAATVAGTVATTGGVTGAATGTGTGGGGVATAVIGGVAAALAAPSASLPIACPFGANCQAAAAAMTSTPTIPAMMIPALVPPAFALGIPAAPGEREGVSGAGRLLGATGGGKLASDAARLCGETGGGSVAGREAGHCEVPASGRGPTVRSAAAGSG